MTWGLQAAPRCQWMVDQEQCGLEHGHDGQHVPYMPGDYLREQLLHPLDLWQLRFHRVCPVCGARLTSWWCDGPERFFRWEDGVGWVETPPECTWRFGPCGHAARELLAWDAIGRQQRSA